MKRLLGIVLLFAPVGWATPISVTGYTYRYGIHVDGDQGFTFNWTPDVTGFYHHCDEASQPCDPSGELSVPLDSYVRNFWVSDGSTSVGTFFDEIPGAVSIRRALDRKTVLPEYCRRTPWNGNAAAYEHLSWVSAL